MAEHAEIVNEFLLDNIRSNPIGVDELWSTIKKLQN